MKTNSLAKQIETTMDEMTRTKPRSQRYAKLQARLGDLRLRQLRLENRIERRKAA